MAAHSFLKFLMRGRCWCFCLLVQIPALSLCAAEKRLTPGHVPAAVARRNLAPLGRVPGTNRLHLALGGGAFTVRRRETADSGPCAGGGRAQKPRTAGPRAGDEPIAPRAGPAIAQRVGADESAGGDLPASQPGISSLPDTERVRRALRADAGGLCGGHPFAQTNGLTVT